MAEETKKTAPEATCAAEEVVVSDVPEAEKPAEVVVEEKVEKEEEGEKGKGKEVEASEEKVEESAPYKEESNKVEDLVDPQKKALDEFKQLIRGALDKREFTAASKVEEPKPVEKKVEEEVKKEEPKPVEKKVEEEEKKEEPKAEESKEVCEAPAEEAVEKKVEEKSAPSPCEEEKPAAENITDKVEAVEEIKETIVHEVTAPAQPPCEELPAAEKAEETTPPPPPPAEVEEVSIWGIPLLSDERTDVILLKFLRARDFKVKEAFTMLKNVVAWRKHFKIEELLEEEGIMEGLDNVVYIHGVDKEGHPVCYNAFGEFKEKELYNNTFADAEKRAKFLRWYIQFLERNIRKLDFNPDGCCTIVQIIDLKNLPGLMLFKLNQATNQALQLLQDNYPEFVAKQVFINVPWWYVAYNRMISPFLTQRTKSKFVFAGPTKTTETLFAYIAPEHVPVNYGGLTNGGDQEFTTVDTATVQIIKPTCKHIIEMPITEACTLVWEVRVVGWDVTYGAEFVPSAEGRYTWVVQKARKIGPADEQVIKCNFPIGEMGKVVLTINNQSTKKKKLLYRYKTKASNQK